jgi:hypothetical protein
MCSLISPYFLIVFLNASVDLGHKIVLQNTIFKTYDGTELMVLTAIINAGIGLNNISGAKHFFNESVFGGGIKSALGGE